MNSSNISSSPSETNDLWLGDGTYQWNDINIIAAGDINIESGGFTIFYSTLVLDSGDVPINSGDAGVVGQFAWSSGFVYICIATNTWRRIQHNTW